MPRYWKITANFHAVGEVIKVVQAPNWQGGLRKGALALKGDPRLKGKKPKAVALTVVETTQERALAHWGQVVNTQLGLTGATGGTVVTAIPIVTEAMEHDGVEVTNEAVPAPPEPEG